MPPRCGAHQHQVRDIHARNQHNQERGSQEDHQGRLQAANHLVLQRPDRSPESFVRLRKALRQLRGDRIHLGLCARHRNAPPQPARHVDLVIAVIPEQFRRICRGGIKLDRVRKAELIGRLEARRQDPDDLVRNRIESQLPTQDVGVAVQAVLPELIRDHHHGIRARTILFRQDAPAQLRLYAHHLEEIRGNSLPPEPLRASQAGEVLQGEGEPRQPLERPALSPVHEIRRRNSSPQALREFHRCSRGPGGGTGPFDPLLPHHHQAIGLGVGKAAKHYAVHDAEHRRVHAQPQAQRHHRRHREGGRLPQRAKCVPEVLCQAFPCRPSPHFLIHLLYTGSVSELLLRSV